MPPDDQDDSRALWRRALGAAQRFAMLRTGNRAMAEDLASEALTAALDPTRSPWDPRKGKTLPQHVVDLVRDRLKTERAKMRVHERAVDAGVVDDGADRAPPRPDERIRAEEQRARGEARKQAVRDGLDDLARRVLDLFGEGCSAGEQASLLDVPVTRIYEARRRIADRIRALPPDDGGGDADTGTMGARTDSEDGAGAESEDFR